MAKFIIGRSWNKHGVGDYYMGKDEKDGQFMFSGKPKAQVFTNQNTAYGMTLRLKRLLPTPIGGGAFAYSVIELTA